ncbi:MAG TPA: histidinol-phosphatase [Chryseolinea sp.]|nr:histidinol-phosphatase [Chryseolinea sp.]
MHSNYCDGKGELRDYVQQALDWRLVSIGCSSHAPVGFSTLWCMKPEKLDAYLQEIDSLNASTPDLQIYKGLEIDFIPGVVSADDFRHRLDYTIGSVHFVDTFPDGRHWEIDGSHTTFMEGVEKIFHGDSRAAITRYYELTRQMINAHCPDIIGHLDKIKIQNIEDKYFKEEDLWYQDQIEQTLEAIARTNAIVEVNTRGLYQGKSTTPYPSPWILERIHQKNIAITLSSDAHHPSDIINRFPDMAKLLLSIGFKTIAVRYNGNWKPFSYNMHGLIQ